MNGGDRFKRLHFHDDQVLDEEIEAVSRLDLDSIIGDRQGHLPFDL